MPEVIRLSHLEARRFHRRAVLLDQPAENVGAALEHHGFIQMDPINVCGRMHDLILRNRVVGYREGGLVEHLHGPEAHPSPAAQRTAFEHHLPGSDVLVALTLEAWPYLLASMRRRQGATGSWSGKMDARQRRLSPAVLEAIRARGPLCSDDIEDQGQRQHHGWGARATLAKTTLHKLFFHGHILIARRAGNRRFYDLPGRVLPASTLARPEPSPAETRRWLAWLKLRQRRLASLLPEELRAVRDLVHPVTVEGCPPLYLLGTDLPLLEPAETPADARLLAPLDPLIYDRRLTRRLWGYDYSWEVYTPAARRVRGYYALPLLVGLELVGHVDPKADRARRKLRVVRRSVRRGHRFAGAVRELARFLRLR